MRGSFRQVSGMASLVRIYGLGLTATFVVMIAIWLGGLIVAPQLTMVEQSLWSRDASGQDLTVEIDRLYGEFATARYDWEHSSSLSERAILDLSIQRLSVIIAQMEEREKGGGRIWGVQNYQQMSGLHLHVFAKTVLAALAVSIATFLLCYPLAVATALSQRLKRRTLLLVAISIPFALNELLRIYAWLMILDHRGLMNGLLQWLGISSEPVDLLHGPLPVLLALVYAHVLFMVFPIHAALSAMDPHLIDAARDLGAGAIRRHWKVILPQARPGIGVGVLMTFMLSVGSYSVPRIMTRGQGGDWFSQLIYRQVFEADNWNVGAAYAVALVGSVLAIIFVVLLVLRLRMRDLVHLRGG
jgi:spermidine/putrescine transport system permease protein